MKKRYAWAVVVERYPIYKEKLSVNDFQKSVYQVHGSKRKALGHIDIILKDRVEFFKAKPEKTDMDTRYAIKYRNRRIDIASWSMVYEHPRYKTTPERTYERVDLIRFEL
jgi:hypothetical protein